MDSQKNSKSNPEIGMQEDSLESAEVAQNAKEGSDAFFNELESQVNGQVYEDPEVTQSQHSGPNKQVTHAQSDNGSNRSGTQSQGSTDWQKRYTDSSREAVKWRDKYNDVEKFVPVLEAMKKDSGLVEHVREYLVNGGRPAKSIQDQLNLGEDFMFDQQEAMTDPESDSAKLMNAHVDGMVQGRVNQMLQAEKKRAVEIQAQKNRSNAEEDFKTKNNMSDEDFASFKAKAQSHKMTLDDINYLVNRDKAAANVAQSTKADMLNQMKNVRNMPTSASGSNSQGGQQNPDREVFDNILGFDSGTDNLFG
tara:strand:- start:1402 stop:2322 length:921 start_codon:yes stop_codon:yes gene_type:complete